MEPDAQRRMDRATFTVIGALTMLGEVMCPVAIDSRQSLRVAAPPVLPGEPVAAGQDRIPRCTGTRWSDT